MDDPRAVRVNNNLVEAQRFWGLMSGIRAFTWLVGIGTILADIVGVSNIMLITVRSDFFSQLFCVSNLFGC